MKKKLIILSCILLYSTLTSPETFTIPKTREMNQATSGPRRSSAPYITGDTFRAACDFVIDEKLIPFDPARVTDGDTIFIRAQNLNFFFTVLHTRIKAHYILVTHNSDFPAPGQFRSYLDDDKLIAWFGQNSDITYHPKFFPIPIGIANAYWAHGDVNVVTNVRLRAEQTRNILCYLNIDNTHPERVFVKNLFMNKRFCFISPRKSYTDFLLDLKRSQFVISPRGNGLDCHRHWEALLMGSIPVIKHSTLDPLFEGLPVILIDDWNNINEEFLRASFVAIKEQKFELERMFAAYWLNKIAQVKQKAKQLYA